MQKKHKRTLERIFEYPVRSDIRWIDIETLLITLGATISEGRGSRVRIYLNGVVSTFHRPHPTPETNKGSVRSVKRFLEEAGIKYHDGI